jgi:uncharacterized protein
MATDPLASDPPIDQEWPASTPIARILSGGVKLLGVLHLPSGRGPHPVVVLLHGFAGNERNFDVAQALRRAGYAALIFHYRGSWGVHGSYTWHNVLEDAVSAVNWTRTHADMHRLDLGRLAVVGHSLGGFAALRTAAGDAGIRAVVSVAGLDFHVASAAIPTDPGQRVPFIENLAGDLLPLQGTDAKALLDEMTAIGEEGSLATLAPHLAGRPVLLIAAGDRDTDTPPASHHRPLVDAFRAHPVPRLEDHEFPTDHAFSDHRVALIRTIVDFLDRNLRGGTQPPP